MKRIFTALILAGMLGKGLSAQAQNSTNAESNPDDNSWYINNLKAPSSPGASLIGISPSVIQRPVTPSAFMVSFMNATNNLSTIPNSYAVDFVPSWLFFGQKITFDDFLSKNLGQNIWQTLDVSFALNNIKDTTTQKTNTQIGIGLKMSLLRGHIKDSTLIKLDGIKKSVTTYALLKRKYILAAIAQPSYGNLTSAEQAALLVKAQEEARAESQALLDQVKSETAALDFTRIGWLVDLAGGLAYNFVNQTNGTLYNSGAWLTGGYQGPKGLAALGIVRFLYNPSVNAAASTLVAQQTYHTLDYGARLLYDAPGNKFTFGGEFVYRDISNNPNLKSSWRYALSTDYQIGQNQVLSFNIGRDFDGTINKGGNLLAALNFVMGFGNNRPVK